MRKFRFSQPIIDYKKTHPAYRVGFIYEVVFSDF